MSRTMKVYIALFVVGCLSFMLGYAIREPEFIVYQVDSSGGQLTGRVLAKEIIDGKYIVTISAYGKFLVTKEQYEAIKVGDPIPDYLKKRGN